jgi:uridine phosphorylase
MKINKLLQEHKTPYLYNFDLTINDELLDRFRGIKFICMQGSSVRARALAKKLAIKFVDTDINYFEPLNMTPNAQFHCYRVGDILSVSHGMGNTSILTLLHSISKIMYFAGNYNVEYIRIGTSGGIGVAAGTVVITETSYMPNLTPGFRFSPLGKEIIYPTNMDGELNKRIINAQPDDLDFKLLMGNSIAADDFYLGQARFDGFLKPVYDEKKRQEYFARIKELNILNFEMESTALAAFCNRAEIPATMIAVTLVNRMEGDQITATHDTLESYSERSSQVAINYLASQR